MFLGTDEAWLNERRNSDVGRASVVGTPSEVTETIRQFAEAGADEFIVPDFTMGSLNRRKDTCDMFIEQVAPNFR
jgi:alkanesulfonate monooxygenase SsuD/methylene tetrahydromethanopterin reductase-like flavin-dependent oxidoreductase (luciferase family)